MAAVEVRAEGGGLMESEMSTSSKVSAWLSAMEGAVCFRGCSELRPSLNERLVA